MDRTETKGQQWAYCLEWAWYNPTATEWYQAKTTALIQFPSVFLCAAAGWRGGRTIMEALFLQSPHPNLHIPQFHIWRRLPPHLRELNNFSLI